LRKYCPHGKQKREESLKGMLLYILIGILLSFAFGYLVYHKAASVMSDQSLAELRRSADASGAEFRVRMDQMMYGMTQAASEPYIKEAVLNRRAAILNELMLRWKRERPYIEIWAFTDSDGKVISALGTTAAGFDMPARNVLLKAVQTGQAVMSVESVPAGDIGLLGKHLGERVNNSQKEVESGEKSGMVQVVAVPVTDDSGVIMGVIVTGILLNGNGELVDSVYSSQNISNAVFLKDNCIAYRFDGESLPGSLKMSQEAYKSLFEKGQGYTGREIFNDTGYIAVYRPLHNIYGQLIGAQVVALREESYNALPGWIRNLSIIMGLFMGAIFLIIALNVGRMRNLLKREKETTHLLNDLRSFSSRLLNCLTEEEICSTFLQHVIRRWEASVVLIRLMGRDKYDITTYRLPSRSGHDNDFDLEKCKSYVTGRPQEYNGRDDDVYCHNGYIKSGVPSYVCIPLNVGGKTIGVAHLAGGPAGYWSDDNLALLQSYIDYLTPAISNIRLLRALEEKAFEDQLTGLKNRRFLDEFLIQHLKISRRQGQPMSVLMLDIDFFKKFNDQYGHDAGDAVLKVFSQTVKECLREADLAARHGGEEFTAVLVNTGMEQSLVVAERIRESVAGLKLTGIDMARPPKITVSIGVSTYPNHGEDPGVLIKAADRALYRAKETGRNRVCTPGEGL